jgi:hypothetical protein
MNFPLCARTFYAALRARAFNMRMTQFYVP